MILEIFSPMFQIEMICLVQVLPKLESPFPTSQNQSDVVSYVAEVLHANGIELVNAFFSQDNIVIILNEKDASRAYDILHSDILKNLIFFCEDCSYSIYSPNLWEVQLAETRKKL